ncbi:hypothetical protein PENTCL1PPCAC_12791, partial [Pristionchus entomophagus]
VLIVIKFTEFAHCSCPDGFDLVSDGECRGLYYTFAVEYFDMSNTAITKCGEIHAQPIIIHNEEASLILFSLSMFHASLIGLVCNLTTKQWVWTDGSPVDYKPPQGLYNPGMGRVSSKCEIIHSDLDKECSDGCNWNVWTTDFYCTKQLQTLTPSEDGCDSFDDDSEDGVCYQIGATAENWKEAEIICRSFGADLASIHNQHENNFVRRLAVSNGAVTGVYLGATISGKGNEYGWIDGSEWDYDNFYPGFPMDGLGDCIVMDTEVTTGHWANADCSSAQSVACIRIQNYTTPACSAGPWKEGQIMYSPGFPFDASTPCDFLLEVDEGKTVELEILLVEANSCCDRLIIFESYLGGNVIANLTGEVSDTTYKTESSNFMRVSWQPTGGVNVRGMMVS